MFTAEERDRLRRELLECAATDQRIGAGAITGSAAAGGEDRWSDIDLAFGVRETADLRAVLEDWTRFMYEQNFALHHLDVRSGEWAYRVFLLPNTLQVDLGFVAATEFRALAPSFKVVFGDPREARHSAPPRPAEVIGLAWLYALHARSCIARGHLWRAEYMISGVRDNALALACIRHGLPAVHGRGMDLLPREVAWQFTGSLVRELDSTEISRAFGAVIQGLLSEIRCVDEELSERLREALTSFV